MATLMTKPYHCIPRLRQTSYNRWTDLNRLHEEAEVEEKTKKGNEIKKKQRIGKDQNKQNRWKKQVN